MATEVQWSAGRCRAWIGAGLVLHGLTVPCVASAQSGARDRYIHDLPPAPAITGQTTASLAFALYGDAMDSEYRDEAPADGIDDARGEVLGAIAERFSPILRRNTFIVPRDVRWVVGDPAVLTIDTWRDGTRIHSDSVHWSPSADSASAVAFDRLMSEADPRRPRPPVLPAGSRTERVLFFDTPGTDAPSWQRAYRDRPVTGSRIYAHPFVDEDTVAAEFAHRFALAIQYWFFYPYNDGANNHEGDWESINVRITTAALAEAARARGATSAPLDASTLRRILDGCPALLDSLVIDHVDYYIHHRVLTLSYIAPGAHLVRTLETDSATYIWEDLRFVEDAIRARMTAAGGRLATHPIGYIGGNSKGPDELLTFWPRFYASHNRTSGATYPFPATWETVGPAGAAEKIHGEIVPPLRHEVKTPAGDTLPWYGVIDSRKGQRYQTYRRDAIVLLPDWERVIAIEDPAARREWAWLYLPVRWGFPAVPSPGAGLIRHANLGNLSPFSPPFTPRWNQLGATAEHERYQPRVLRTPVSPTGQWALVQNGWGVLNHPMAVWSLLPGYNVGLIQLMPWITGTLHLFGSPPARTFSPTLPMRFTSEGQGVFFERGGKDFARAMLPDRDLTAWASLQAARPHAVPDLETIDRALAVGPRFWLSLHFGPRLAIENTFSFSQSSIAYQLRDTVTDERSLVRGTLRLKELSGGFRYSVRLASEDAVHMYARAGYGWTWYAVRDVTVDGALLIDAEADGGYYPPLLPSRDWMPNTMYGGVGVEYFSPKQHWLLRRLGYGIRADVGGSLHRVRTSHADDRRATAQRMDGALALIFGW